MQMVASPFCPARPRSRCSTATTRCSSAWSWPIKLRDVSSHSGFQQTEHASSRLIVRWVYQSLRPGPLQKLANRVRVSGLVLGLDWTPCLGKQITGKCRRNSPNAPDPSIEWRQAFRSARARRSPPPSWFRQTRGARFRSPCEAGRLGCHPDSMRGSGILRPPGVPRVEPIPAPGPVVNRSSQFRTASSNPAPACAEPERTRHTAQSGGEGYSPTNCTDSSSAERYSSRYSRTAHGVANRPTGHRIASMYCFSWRSISARWVGCSFASTTSASSDPSGLVTIRSGSKTSAGTAMSAL